LIQGKTKEFLATDLHRLTHIKADKSNWTLKIKILNQLFNLLLISVYLCKFVAKNS